MQKQPLLSVCMITYNHEAFILQALEGVLMQQTSFYFDVVLANDASSDATDKVLEAYLKNHPQKHVVQYINHPKNKGMYDNMVFALRACTGKYVALCEGDDYWTDPFKLQKQVDFLETNSDYEVCFTNIKVVRDDNSVKKDMLIADKRQTVYEKKDLPIWAPTLTRVFRNRNFKDLPYAPGLDTIMLLWQSQYGKIKFLDEVTGVYRLHGGGVYSSRNKGERKIAVLKTQIACLDYIHAPQYKKYCGLLFKKLVELYALDRQLYQIALRNVKQAFYRHLKNMPFYTQLLVGLSLVLLYLPVLKGYRQTRELLIRFFNHIFIY